MSPWSAAGRARGRPGPSPGRNHNVALHGLQQRDELLLLALRHLEMEEGLAEVGHYGLPLHLGWVNALIRQATGSLP